ncbi:hypothetical protein [Nocardia xishanensis]|uniref:hypothetical protein n=1 Tax=Nocardia xishanensis TaxID=238964 RepID=UPI0012F4AD84|nr:hypothetical protein [Nocardia xishanensis]
MTRKAHRQWAIQSGKAACERAATVAERQSVVRQPNIEDVDSGEISAIGDGAVGVGESRGVREELVGRGVPRLAPLLTDLVISRHAGGIQFDEVGDLFELLSDDEGRVVGRARELEVRKPVVVDDRHHSPLRWRPAYRDCICPLSLRQFGSQLRLSAGAGHAT